MTAATTPKGERRRQALISAGAELLREAGFDAVRHRAVADRAEMPLASTTYYFESIDELVTAAVEHLARSELGRLKSRLADFIDRDRAAADVIEFMLDALLGLDSAGGGLDVVLPHYERFVATGRRPYLRPLMQRLRAELDCLLGEALAHVGRAVDQDELDRLVALVDGAVINALIQADPDPREAARRRLRREWHL